jgi:hypothetical protein
VRANRKGVTARWGLKKAVATVATRRTGIGLRRNGADEPAADGEVHIHQGPGSVDPAGVRRRRSSLPREVCVVLRKTQLRGS